MPNTRKAPCEKSNEDFIIKKYSANTGRQDREGKSSVDDENGGQTASKEKCIKKAIQEECISKATCKSIRECTF